MIALFFLDTSTQRRENLIVHAQPGAKTVEEPTRNEKAAPNERDRLSKMQRACLKRAYGSSRLPALVFDDGDQIVFANDAAFEFFERRCQTLKLPSFSQEALFSAQLTHLIQHALGVHDRAEENATLWQEGFPSALLEDVEITMVPLPLSTEASFSLCLLKEGAAMMSEDVEKRREQRRLRAVIENLPIVVLLYNAEGHILELNQQVREIVGRSQWRKIGERDHPFVVCDTEGRPLPREEWPLFRVAQSGRSNFQGDVTLDFGDHRRTLSITVTAIVDTGDDEVEYLVTGHDITQRIEESRRKDDFLTVASHELRGPLTPLTGLIQLCRKQAEASATVDPDLLRRAESQVLRLRRLIDGLLDLSRLERGTLLIERQEILLTDLIAQVVEPWLNGPERHRITLNVPDEPVAAYIDPDRIDQVLTNVIDNALKHGRPNGLVHVQLEAGDDLARLVVRDEGDGIPEELLHHVFDRFFFGAGHRGESARSSSLGLGLYISRQIVESHGGQIKLESALGSPTVVTIELPLTLVSDSRPLIA